jgi:hypothetical protein
MTEQRLSAQNPRELTANELDRVAGGASDVKFENVTTGVVAFRGSTISPSGNGGAENPSPKGLGTTNFIQHLTVGDHPTPHP